MKPIIQVKNLSKKYKLGEAQPYYTLRDSLAGMFSNPFKAAKTSLQSNEFWALQDLNFEVQHGEVVGIVGRNGAGKSTLLKILSQITPPTEGEIVLRGRVGSLLEVGTGFSPELTGRENIFLNGAILGMKHSEVKQKFDEIVAFSDIEKFLDTPLKRYSSGMYMRLAFSVAAHLESEILIVDEVLAVGDAEFQKKCLGKMGEVANDGRTILFVSHNMTALKSLCKTAILLEGGRVTQKGTVQQIADKYLVQAETQLKRVWKNVESAPGNTDVKITRAEVVIPKSESFITVETDFKIEFDVISYIDSARLNFSLVLSNPDGVVVFNSISESAQYKSGRFTGSCRVPGKLLNDDTYRVMIMITRNRSEPLFYKEDILIFEVKDVPRAAGWQGKWPGVVRPQLTWSTRQIK